MAGIEAKRRPSSILKGNIEMAKNCALMLHILNMDLQLQRDGFDMIVAIDFSDVFRYLHPRLDRTQAEDWDSYQREQTALHYLFEKHSKKLLLLPPYIKEFLRHLYTAHARYEKVSKAKTMEELIVALREIDEPSPNEETKKVEEAFKVSGRIEFPTLKQLLKQQSLREEVIEAVDVFISLVENNKIVLAKAYGDCNLEALSAYQKINEYFYANAEMLTLRPKRAESNEMDAQAIAMVKGLSDANKYGKRSYFVLLSSTRAVKDILLGVKIEINSKGQTFRIPALRDLYYVLMAYFFRKMTTERAIAEIAEYKDKITTYIDLVGKLEKVIGDKYDEVLDETAKIYRELRHTLWDLGSIVTEIRSSPTGFSRVRGLDEWKKELEETNRRVDELVAKPGELQARVELAMVSLSLSIEKLRHLFYVLTGEKYS